MIPSCENLIVDQLMGTNDPITMQKAIKSGKIIQKRLNGFLIILPFESLNKLTIRHQEFRYEQESDHIFARGSHR